ncbi:MAG: response regulator [Alphaproteobacteria bacterium]
MDDQPQDQPSLDDRSRILVVDDTPANLHILLDALTDDYTVIVARDGSSALNLAGATPAPDLILLDVVMPEMDGYGVCERLKTSPATRTIPVIFLTALDEEASEARGLQLGAVDYLRKPICLTTLRLRVNLHLELLQARRRLEKQNQQLIEAAHLREDVERNLTIVGRLAAGVAHEINTPIQYIGTNARFISDSFASVLRIVDAYERLRARCQAAGTITDELKEIDDLVEEHDLPYLRTEIPEAIAQSQVGIEQVSRIVLSMKEFSHPGVIQRNASDINRAIRNTATLSRNQWKECAEMVLDLEEGIPPVTCRVSEINQVLLNLIVNAAQAIDASGHGRGKIEIATRRKGDFVEIRVTDSGSGVPDDIRDRIFEPFFTTKDIGKGTGQGLAICQDIITKRHGGQIFVEGETGHGAIFVIRLPIG